MYIIYEQGNLVRGCFLKFLDMESAANFPLELISSKSSTKRDYVSQHRPIKMLTFPVKN